MEIQLPESERRWFHAALVLGTLVLAFVLLSQVAVLLVFFSDILLVVLLAWLLAFMIAPVVGAIMRAFPQAPRVGVVGAIYTALFLGLSWLTIVVAGSLAASIGNFVRELPGLQARLPELLEPVEGLLASLGFQIDIVTSARELLDNLGALGDDLVGPLTNLALAGLGIAANLLLVIFLSLFIVLDKDRIVAYLNRLVPPQHSETARLFETSVVSSFGGLIRGQAIQGLIYATVAVVTHLAFGLEFLPASAALVGVLQALPFFGPFLSWAPPVVVALLTKPEMVIPVLIVMGIGWFVVMNLVVPRLMAKTIGIHPVAVLIAVLVGLKVAGIAGAVFALPFAAIMAAFFHHFLARNANEPRDVASRAARRVGEREGRAVRVPKEPNVGVETAGVPADQASDAPTPKRAEPGA
ncbi:AI-2E family transporter [soil metagenome]